MNKKIIAALLVFVMVFSLAAPVMADYRTGSAVGDGVVYGAGGAAVGGGTYLGWYGATGPDKNLKKDIENIAAAGVYGTTAGIGSIELINEGAKNALQAAF